MFVEIRHIEKWFGNEKVLDKVTFDLESQRLLSILGRSGCGKTTLLKIIAGLEKADSGEVLIKGEDFTNVPAHQRGIVYLYQEPLLFPHLSVFENIAFGLRLRKVGESEVRKRVNDLLQELGLEGQGKKRTDQLSGGQRQRVAFGRALIIHPRLLLLDEPFGALDTETRRSMQGLLKRIVKEHQITTLFVTHDLKEALLMGDEVALMESGKLKKYVSPQAFVEDPASGVKEEVEFWKKWG
jgi:ABC-type Fe3+/spermidine/putrescine transport system ATPase subunit